MLNFQPINLELLKKHFNLIMIETPNEDNDEILSKIDVAFAPLGFKFNKEKIDKMPKLKVIASNTTGEPHIDRKYAESKDVEVISLKFEQEFLKTITPTAEHTWGLLLALMRRTPWAFNSVLSGTWNRRLFGGKGMLSKLSIGIVGLGRLGSLVAQYAKAFGLKKIKFFDPYIDEREPNGLERVNRLEDLVSSCDIITIHIPAEKKNYKIFNANLFAKFKRGSYLINTSRGELVDEVHMINALKSGILAGAAIDVFDGEYEMNHDELLQKSILLKYAQNNDNLLITPHIGGSTIDAWRLTEEYTIKLILKLLKIDENT
ncbi:MAG: NAD(P)-dependent oxidoreductase [Promethearchaeota archaeon]